MLVYSGGPLPKSLTSKTKGIQLSDWGMLGVGVGLRGGGVLGVMWGVKISLAVQPIAAPLTDGLDIKAKRPEVIAYMLHTFFP